jgi:hypothetical protein
VTGHLARISFVGCGSLTAQVSSAGMSPMRSSSTSDGSEATLGLRRATGRGIRRSIECESCRRLTELGVRSSGRVDTRSRTVKLRRPRSKSARTRMLVRNGAGRVRAWRFSHRRRQPRERVNTEC